MERLAKISKVNNEMKLKKEAEKAEKNTIGIVIAL